MNEEDRIKVFLIIILLLIITSLYFNIKLKESNIKLKESNIKLKESIEDYNILVDKYNTLNTQYDELHYKYTLENIEGDLNKLNCLLNIKEQIYKEYNYTDNFQCLNFSKEFKERALKECNVYAPVVYGQLEEKDNYTLHAWNRFYIDIDATWNEWKIQRPVYDFKGEWIER